jgi:hypothetical protein
VDTGFLGRMIGVVAGYWLRGGDSGADCYSLIQVRNLLGRVSLTRMERGARLLDRGGYVYVAETGMEGGGGWLPH